MSAQFLNYHWVLEAQDPERHLYLAVPFDAHATFFTLPFAQSAIHRYQLKLLVYDGQSEEITQWQS